METDEHSLVSASTLRTCVRRERVVGKDGNELSTADHHEPRIQMEVDCTKQ